ncbi:Albumin-2 protein [Spatholobus suberectus]|nr:Albumin-2 protein [Spatholobus suberectus]
MSIPPNAPGRSCAASLPQPVREEGRRAAENLENTLHRVNCIDGHLNQIVYRSSTRNWDLNRPLVRWDRRPYQQIFAQGFRAWPQGNTPDNIYYNLDHYVHQAGPPLDPNRPQTHVFVGTTLNDEWRPNPNLDTLPRGQAMHFYRYEVYAPGGIWVAVTLRGQYHHFSQAEVCFAGGIAPQYIRSCVVYTAIRDPDSNFVSFFRAEIKLIINAHFNPQAYPYVEVSIILPTHTYLDEDGEERYLPEETYTPDRQKREVSYDNVDAALEWYTHKVVEVPIYITAAFRSARKNEAYFFMKNKYVLVDYAPGTTDDKVLNGPIHICDGFPSLMDTPFGEQGIDCAFGTDYYTGFPFYTAKTEAFIFAGNLCAYIDYAPGTTDDKIISGPMTIVDMFPFFKNTVFENGIDAAINATNSHEVYLFSGDNYALINYDSKKIINVQVISEGFPSLQGTIFASDIDAAFASHRTNEAYLFKGEFYAPINFAPGTTDDYIIGGRIKKILPNWPSLSKILPIKNKGLDYHVHHSHEPDHEPDQHDEL